jgi:hypothetical protein
VIREYFHTRRSYSLHVETIRHAPLGYHPPEVLSQRLAVDDSDVESERIEAFDAAEVDAVVILGVLAVGEVGEDLAGLAGVVAET